MVPLFSTTTSAIRRFCSSGIWSAMRRLISSSFKPPRSRARFTRSSSFATTSRVLSRCCSRPASNNKGASRTKTLARALPGRHRILPKTGHEKPTRFRQQHSREEVTLRARHQKPTIPSCRMRWRIQSSRTVQLKAPEGRSEGR